MVEEFQMGSVGPEDGDSETEPEEVKDVFIPKQVTPEQDLTNKVKATTEAGLRRVSSVVDIMEDDEKLTWVIEDLLPDTGLMYVAGLSGTGKTILAIQLVGDIVLGRPTMAWRLGEAWHADFRTLMLSLEMPKKELQLRLQHMFPNLTDEERKEFHNRFMTYTEPEPFELWNPVHIVDLIRLIKAHNVNLLLIDSASVSFASSLKNDEQVNDSIKNLYMLRSRLNCAMIIVAHTRKPSMDMVNNPENITLNELFGHSGVAQSASSIVIMLEDEKQRKEVIKSGKQDDTEKLVHIVNAKSRFGANSGAFKSYLTSKSDVDKGEALMFRRNAIPIAPTDKQRREWKREPGTKMRDALSDVDFGALLDGDE